MSETQNPRFTISPCLCNCFCKILYLHSDKPAVLTRKERKRLQAFAQRSDFQFTDSRLCRGCGKEIDLTAAKELTNPTEEELSDAMWFIETAQLKRSTSKISDDARLLSGRLQVIKNNAQVNGIVVDQLNMRAVMVINRQIEQLNGLTNELIERADEAAKHRGVKLSWGLEGGR